MVSIDFRNTVAPKSLTLWQAQLEAVHMIFLCIIDQFLFLVFGFDHSQTSLLTPRTLDSESESEPRMRWERERGWRERG